VKFKAEFYPDFAVGANSFAQKRLQYSLKPPCANKFAPTACNAVFRPYIQYIVGIYRIITIELDRSTLGDDMASTWVAKPEVHAEV